MVVEWWRLSRGGWEERRSGASVVHGDESLVCGVTPVWGGSRVKDSGGEVVSDRQEPQCAVESSQEE